MTKNLKTPVGVDGAPVLPEQVPVVARLPLLVDGIAVAIGETVAVVPDVLAALEAIGAIGPAVELPPAA